MARTQMSITPIPRGGLGFTLSAADDVNGIFIDPGAITNGRTSGLLCLFRTAQPSVTITVKSGPPVDDDLVVSDRVIVLAPNQTYIWPVKNLGIYLQTNGQVYIDSNGPYQACFLNT